MTPAQLHAVRQTYSNSFSEGMKICAITSAACVLATLITWRKVPIDIVSRRKEQHSEHLRRLKMEKELRDSGAVAAESGVVVGEIRAAGKDESAV